MTNRFASLILTVFVLALDRWSKIVVQRQIPIYSRRTIVRGFFQITHTENTGAAFSLFASSTSPWTERGLVAFSVLALLVLGYLLTQQESAFSRSAIAISLIMGGALGNLWDRIAHGRVVDFLLFFIGKYEWPVFNLADSCIVIGAGLLAVSILTHKPSNGH